MKRLFLLQIRFFPPFAACVAGLLAYLLWSAYQHEEAAAETTARNLTEVISSRIQGDFSRIDGMLAHVADDDGSEFPAGRPPGKAVAVSSRLASLIQNFDAVAGIYVFDADGALRLASQETSSFSISDRPHFLRLRDTRAVRSFSEMLLSRSTGRWSLIQARPIRAPDGRFLGTVNAVIDMDALAHRFSGIYVGPRGFVLLRRSDDFKLIQRVPPLNVKDFNQPLPADHAIRQRIEAGARNGSLSYISSTDGMRRLGSFKQLDNFPFYVQVAVSPDDYMASWRSETLFTIVLGGGLLVGLGMAIVAMARSERKSVELQDALREETARQDVLIETLAENEQRLANILWGTNAGTWEWNVQTGETRFNERWAELIGYTLAELVPLSIETWMKHAHPDDLAASNAELERYFSGETDAYVCAARMHHKDGRWVWVLDRGRLVSRTGDGKPLWMAGTHIDISTLKHVEAELRERTLALERSNTELEQFSYSISHDMRQPLRMISSYLQLIETSLGASLDAEQRGYFHFATDGAQRLDAMLVGLLEYSRVGRKGEPPVWLESRTVLDDALLFLQPAVAEAQAVVRVAGDWPRLFAGRDELLRLLQNLVGNALKFRVAGRLPEVDIVGEHRPGVWRCCIADNGIGILPDQAGRLFQVFQRLQSRTRYEGTGIGLALCRKIVEHHGGRLWVESPGENQGSRFCFEIPLEDEVVP